MTFILAMNNEACLSNRKKFTSAFITSHAPHWAETYLVNLALFSYSFLSAHLIFFSLVLELKDQRLLDPALRTERMVWSVPTNEVSIWDTMWEYITSLYDTHTHTHTCTHTYTHLYHGWFKPSNQIAQLWGGIFHTHLLVL